VDQDEITLPTAGGANSGIFRNLEPEGASFLASFSRNGAHKNWRNCRGVTLTELIYRDFPRVVQPSYRLWYFGYLSGDFHGGLLLEYYL